MVNFNFLSIKLFLYFNLIQMHFLSFKLFLEKKYWNMVNLSLAHSNSKILFKF